MAMRTREVELVRLEFPESRLYADPKKLADLGPFDMSKYEPIWVEETSGGSLIATNGVTCVTAARLAGITKLPAYVFPKR
jgi:hypothetical protein